MREKLKLAAMREHAARARRKAGKKKNVFLESAKKYLAILFGLVTALFTTQANKKG